MPLQISYTGTYLTPPGRLLVSAPGTGNWTIQAWVAPPPIFATYYRTIWYLNNGHALRMTPAQKLQFVYGAGGDEIATLSPSTWYCVTVRKQGATAVRYYLNGVFQSQRTTGLSSDDTAAATIGAWNGSSDWLFATMSNVTAWDALLTDTEIAQEYATRRPRRTDNLRAWYPFLDRSVADFVRDYSGNGRHLTPSGTLANSTANPEPPVGYGASVFAVDSPYGPAPKTVFTERGRRVKTPQPVTVVGGSPLKAPLIELAYDGAADGRYSGCVPANRIRAVSGKTGIKKVRTYLSDNANVQLEIANADGAYTDGGGLWVGMWAKVRLAGSGEVLFTGRITELTPGYGVSSPYVSVSVETARNDLDIPAQSVLLKDTNTKEAATALLDGLDLTNGGGFFMFDKSLFDGDDVLAPLGSDNVRTYGGQWMSLATAGGYGKPDGEMDVLRAVADLMKAEDGRAVWAADGVLELYSRQYLDDVRDGGPADVVLTDDELVSADFSVGSEYINDLTLTWTPTRWQAGAALYTYEPDTAASIQPGESREFNVRYRLTGSDRVLAAESVSVVITQTGPTVTYDWPGGVSATGGKLRVVNTHSSEAAAITKIAVTGTALIQSEKAEVRRQDNEGVSLYGTRTLKLDASLIDREMEAVSRAQREFVAWNERASFAGQVTLIPRTRAAAVEWLTRPFATPVAVKSTRLAHDARYLMLGCDWRVGEGGVPVDVTVYLEPNAVNGLFTFDSDERGFDAGKLA